MTFSSDKRWPVIQNILITQGIAKQHLNSFDEFLENGLQEIINEVKQIEIENAGSLEVFPANLADCNRVSVPSNRIDAEKY